MLKRLLNLWKLSEYEVPKVGQKLSELPVGTNIITSLFKKPEKPTIITKEDLYEGIIEQ